MVYMKQDLSMRPELQLLQACELAESLSSVAVLSSNPLENAGCTFKPRNLERIEDQVFALFRHVNFMLKSSRVPEDYFDDIFRSTLLTYDLVAPLLNMNNGETDYNAELEAQHRQFSGYLGVDFSQIDPIQFHISSDGLQDTYDIWSVCELIAKEKHKFSVAPGGFRRAVYRTADQKLKELNDLRKTDFSDELHLLAFTYCFVLGPMCGSHTKQKKSAVNAFLSYYNRAVRGKGQVTVSFPLVEYVC